MDGGHSFGRVFFPSQLKSSLKATQPVKLEMNVAKIFSLIYFLGPKSRVIVIQKEKRQPGLFILFLNNKMTLLFATHFLELYFTGSQNDPCFQNKNRGCRLTGRVGSFPILKNKTILKGSFNNYVDKMRGGGGQKMTKFCPRSC